MRYKLGKKPARPNAIKFKLAEFVNLDRLGQPPADGFGHDALPDPQTGFGHYGKGAGLDWGVLANDRWGDCFWAGRAHATMILTHHAADGQPVLFREEDVLADYAAATSFSYTDATDFGTDMQQGLDYCRSVGIRDARGRRHRVSCYLALEAGNFEQLRKAIFNFGVADIGLRFPTFAWEQFKNGAPWDWTEAASVRWDGGHYVPGGGENSIGQIIVPSWGRTHGMTRSFYENCCDEAAVCLDFDILDARGYSPEGIDRAGLEDRLSKLGGNLA